MTLIGKSQRLFDLSPSVDRLLEGMKVGFRGEILCDYPLSRLTTFRVGGPAAVVAVPSCEEDVEVAVKLAADAELPLLVMGRGSNLLVSDFGFPGLVLLLKGGRRIAIAETGADQEEGEGCLAVMAEASMTLNGVISWCVRRGLGGLEPLVGIPGTLGGAIVMNAGANQREISECLVKLYVYDGGGAGGKGWYWIDKGDIEFGYRSSSLGERIIYKALLKVIPLDKDELEERCRRFQLMRKARQPLSRSSAGSVFKNGENYLAGEVIERCGCKGWRVGGALVSPKHANFIVNAGGARAGEVLELIERIREWVFAREGIELELELELVGPF